MSPSDVCTWNMALPGRVQQLMQLRGPMVGAVGGTCRVEDGVSLGRKLVNSPLQTALHLMSLCYRGYNMCKCMVWCALILGRGSWGSDMRAR
jgi:hypothetical protein